MEYTTLVLILAVFYGLYHYLKNVYSYFKDRGIPFLRPWPVFGNMASIMFRQEGNRDFVVRIYNCNQAAKYVGVYNFLTPTIMIRDLELIKDVTITSFRSFMNHKIFVDPEIDPLFAQNLFSMMDEQWKEARNLLLPAFTSSKMKAMYELMVPCAENMVNYMANLPESERNLVETKNFFSRYANDIIATCAFGIEVDSLKNPQNEFYTLGQRSINFQGSLGVKTVIARGIPYIMKLFRIKLFDDEITNFFKQAVDSTMKTREEQGITRPDMIQLMMDARGKSQTLKLDLMEITAQAFIFFFGGFDTTSTQMCLLAQHLAIEPDIHKRLQAEVDEVLCKIPPGSKVSYDAINSMPYLDAVFHEALRLYPQAAFLERLCNKSYELPPALPGLKPYMIRPGDSIWIPSAGIHLDPEYYKDPYKFDPDRHLGKKIIINDNMLLSFGLGPRSCIGNRFAILETKLLIFHLLAKFNIQKSVKTDDVLELSSKSIAPMPKSGFWVKFEKRN